MFQDKVNYLNFPIALLKTIHIDLRDCMTNIISIATYNRCLQLFEGYSIEGMEAAASDLGMRLGNAKESMESAKIITDSIVGKSVMVGVRKDIIFDYYENYKSKSEFQIASFCAFCAIRSVIGKKKSCKTNKAQIQARMFGFNSTEELTADLDYFPERLKDLKVKYEKRYHIDKVIKELELNWYLKLFADHCRGFYLSFNVSHQVLANACIAGKKSLKAKKIKELKKAALLQAMSDNERTAYSTAT